MTDEPIDANWEVLPKVDPAIQRTHNLVNRIQQALRDEADLFRDDIRREMAESDQRIQGKLNQQKRLHE